MSKPALVFLKWVALFVGSLGSLASGSLMVFTVYQNALKSTYNYTQSEVEILPSMLNVGCGLAFIPGMIFDRFGPLWTNILALILSTGGYLLIWSSASGVTFYKNKVWLLSIYFLIAGLGSIATYISTLNTNVANFSNRYRGTVIGLLCTCYGLGPIVLTLIYYRIFVNVAEAEERIENYPGFMLTLALMLASANVLCVLFVRDYRQKEADVEGVENIASNPHNVGENLTLLDKAPAEITEEGVDEHIAKSGPAGDEKTHSCNSTVKYSGQHYGSKKFSDLMKNVHFHLLGLMFACTTTPLSVVSFNLTTSTKSVNFSRGDHYLTLISPIAGVISSLFVGVFSDKLKGKLPRDHFLIACNISMVIVMILLTFWVEVMETFITAFVIHGCVNGTIWSITPTQLSECFGLSTFGRNWGLLILESAIFLFAGLALFGYLYDLQIDIPGEHQCYGLKCIQRGYGAMLALSALGLASEVISFLKRKYSKPQSETDYGIH